LPLDRGAADADPGAADGGGADRGAPDAGVMDAAGADRGATDAGVMDAGSAASVEEAATGHQRKGLGRMRSEAGLALGPGLDPVEDPLAVHCQRLQRFAERFAEHPARIRAQLAAADWQQARASAHALSGVALSLGVSRVGAAAKAIESAIGPASSAKSAPSATSGPLQRQRPGSLEPQLRALEQAFLQALASIQRLSERPELAAAAVSEPAEGSEPLDALTLRPRLQRIDTLLAARNLRARSEIESLVPQITEPDVREALERVLSAAQRFDFRAARSGLGDLLSDALSDTPT
jgi:HPt (histidine-containing phosphotransfer) domain-containing protein